MLIESSKFEHVYRQLLYVTRSHFPDIEPTFSNGLWKAEEGYKSDFWGEARTAMSLASWPEHVNDPMYIISKATQPFGILMSDSHKQQNLVSNQNYSKLFEIMSSAPAEAASVLYDVFFGGDDEAAFKRLAKLLGRKSMNDPVSVASLFFFLKNRDKYVTARKEGTGERLGRLGLSSSCLQRCTWEGYQQYLSIIKELREKLLAYQPEATLLDAQSFLWMLRMVNPDTPEYQLSRRRMLFCNIAWMEEYDHICFPEDKPRYGGSYVASTGSAFESWNFHRYYDGYYGFVETKYTGGTADQDKANQLHIEKIDPSATGDSIDNVTVIFCAHSDEVDNTVIVGWYEDATVLRYRKQHLDGHMYNLTTDKAVLLPEILRTKVIPRARSGEFGFGQSNLRYPTGNAATGAVKDVLAYIEGFQGTDAVKVASDKAIAGLSDEQLMWRIGETSQRPAPTYSSTTIQRKRNPYLTEQARRLADGICQLCRTPAPFNDKNGRPYLEAHHVIPLAEDGPDTLDNIVALCPNCHRKMHIVCDMDDVAQLMAIASLLTDR